MSVRGILDVDMAMLGNWVSGGWHWWLDELADFVPRRWRNRSSARLAMAPWDETHATFQPERDGAFAVVLPHGLVLHRRIESPLMGERDLASMIALDARRLMPLGAEGAVIGARVVARDDQIGRMAVELAALPRASAKVLADAIAAAPRAPMRVYTKMPDADGDEPLDLLPALHRARLVAGEGRNAATAWAILGFLFALNIGVLVWRDVASVDALSVVVDQQDSAVGVAHRVIDRMHAQNSLIAGVLAARHTREPLAMIGHVANALPKGCWLSKFTWTADTIRLSGFHPHDADVAGALRRAGLPVIRYSDAGEAPTPLGEPFEATLGMGKP